MTQPARKADGRRDRHVATAAELSAANINPRTGLAADYLNHFNDALMLLDIVQDTPDGVGDFLAWQPLSYSQHFNASYFAARDLVISAYENADPDTRIAFDALTGEMTAILVEVGHAIRAVRRDDDRAKLAGTAAERLRPLMIHAGSVIRGDVADKNAHARTAMGDGS